MNVGVITPVKYDIFAGVGRVIHDTMTHILNQDKKNKYILMQENIYGLPTGKIDTGWILPEYRIDNMMDVLCYDNKIDVLYSLFPAISVKGNYMKVLTMYDLIPLIFPEYHLKVFYETFNSAYRKSALEADKIIAISQATKNDIIKYYGVNEKKIEVVYLGIQPALLKKEEPINLKERFNIIGEYILSVCTIEPRKNLKGLVDAFLNYKERHPKSEIQLVLTGHIGWGTEIINYIQNCKNYSKDIILTGYVSDAELATLMKKSLAVAYVSFYEGFGLPILEGMAAGKAVISSNTSSMPEVGGDAVAYCNPYDMESMVHTMELVVENEGYRKSLEKKALARASLFSYEKTAEQVIRVLQGVM